MNVVPSRYSEVLGSMADDKHAWQLFLQSKKMEAVGSLAGGLAHDFNNILTSIHASAQSLRTQDNLTDAQREAISDIEHQVICGAEVIKQLLQFTKPEHTKRSKAPALLNHRLLLFRRLLSRIMPRNIRIRLDTAEPECSMKIAPAELEQIMLNLVMNAKDAMPNGGTIGIKSRMVRHSASNPCLIPEARRGTYAQLEVSDEGKGIAAENISRIFDPYYSSKHKKGGTGLGLAIVYSIVQRHKGYIMASSSSSSGTTFTLLLPARKAAARKATDTKFDPKQFLGGGETIMLVDDEPIIAKSTAHFLERYGYRVITAGDGSSALTEYRQRGKNIDLVILDLEMPEMDGSQCLCELLAMDPDAKVITMSGHFIKTGSWDPVKAGAKAFLQKPFDTPSLLAAIRSTANGEAGRSPGGNGGNAIQVGDGLVKTRRAESM